VDLLSLFEFIRNFGKGLFVCGLYPLDTTLYNEKVVIPIISCLSAYFERLYIAVKLVAGENKVVLLCMRQHS